MAIIQDAITSLMGGGGSEDWLSQLRPGSFRGVPFAVVNEEGSHGRRQAVHEYPYRDTAWIEDMGRGTRRFIIRGFIVQNSLVYGGGDVISQRQSLINACEAKGSGTLIHPTLGEMTVSIPENGLRLSGSADNGRSFEFTLMVIESGLKVFAVTDSAAAGNTVGTNYLKLVSTTVASTLARIKSEIRGVSQGIQTIRGTVTFWTNMVDNTISEVTNVSNVLDSTFGNNRYGRYSKGTVGGSSSGINGNRDADDSEDHQALSEQVTARAVMDRQAVLDTTAALNESVSVEEFVQGVADVINRILSSAGSVSDKIAAFEKLAASTSTGYQRSESSQQLAGTMNTLIVVLCTGGSGGGTTVPAGGIGSGGNILNITGGISQGGLYYGSDAFIGGAGGSAFSSTGGNGHFGSSGDDGGFPGSGGAGGNGNYSSGKGANGLVYLEEFS